MKSLKDRVKTEIKSKMNFYSGDWIAIHKNTAKHILKVLKKGKK